LRCYAEISSRYAKLFSGGGVSNWFSLKWGWYDVIIKMVGFEKRNEIFKTPIFEFLNHMAYLKDVDIFKTDIK
jgi:hypothetical protein